MVQLTSYQTCINKCGTFMDAMSKPPPLAYISQGRGVFHEGRNICDTLGSVRSMAETTDKQTDGHCHYI